MPERCQCDQLPPERGVPADKLYSHQHYLHSLLELLFQQALEECDEWILGPADARPSEPRLRWSENPELLPHLAKHPTLAGLLRSKKGILAVYEWAGVTSTEAHAFEMHLIGWVDEVIATDMREQEITVRQWYLNAQSRIETAMALVDWSARDSGHV